MDQCEKAMAYIDEHEEEMMNFWRNIVRLESQSGDLEGVAEVAAHLDTYCAALGLNSKKYIFEHAGPSLAAWTRPGELAPVALMGHMDTVHKRGSFGEDTFRMEEGRIHGPGVYDCKGGIATAFLVLKALMHAGYSKRQIKILLVGDEETAHGLSKEGSLKLYQEEARGCAAAFNCESGLLNGDVITRRKGGQTLTFKVKGIASHAGAAPRDGASAIAEAARKIVDIEGLTDYEGTTYNCGIITGGSGVNIIPDSCEFKVGVRFAANEAQKEALKSLQEIADRTYIEGTKTEMTVLAGFKAMELTDKTDALFAEYRKASESLGYGTPKTVYSGGCSDGAYVALEGVPVLCGVGVRGANNHSLEEYAVGASMKERAKILAKTILELPDQF